MTPATHGSALAELAQDLVLSEGPVVATFSPRRRLRSVIPRESDVFRKLCSHISSPGTSLAEGASRHHLEDDAHVPRLGERSHMTYQVRMALARIDLFAGLSETTLADLVQRGTTFTTSPGRRVVEQGANDVGLQVVLDGTADVSVNGVRRPSLILGDYLGEISMIDGAPRSATVVAGPDGLTIFRLSALAFAPMLEDPTVARTLLKALCARIRSLETMPADHD